jgi:squalene-associated FAD-dependent desaturase
MSRIVHIIGAGLAGLSAAVELAQSSATVVVHEAMRQAGGRCRSYADAATGLTIDNGNHLLLSGNRAALSYLKTIGSASQLIGPADAAFPFVDLASGKRWTIRISGGRIPWWIFDAKRRVPDTSPMDYLPMARLLWASAEATGRDVLPCRGPLYDRLVHPLLLAALNTDPAEGSAKLAGAIVRETLASGGRACRPLIARDGLSPVLIEPALDFLRGRNVAISFEHELRRITFGDGVLTELDFGDGKVPLGANDVVIVAVPAYAARPLVPNLDPPSSFRAIVNAHFRAVPPPGSAPIVGVLNGTIEWLFAFPDRLSVTISAADRLMATPREALAQTIWSEVARITGLSAEMPPWQVVRERRATFAATPTENAKRPPAETAWKNLFLAGDWTATGLPATIEGAIRSGQRAALRATQAISKAA